GAARGGRIASCRTYPADGDPGVNVSGLAEAGMPAPRGPRQGRYSKSPKMPCLTGERCREASERARTSSRCATYQSYDCTNISSFDQRGVQPSFALACERSKNISRPYISEWYAPSGERPSALVASIAGITSRAGSERTRLPVPACCTSASSASRIGPEALGANVEGVGPRQLAGAEQVLGAAHVHALEQVPILRERHLGDVVVDDVDPLARALDRIRVAHIAAEIAHLARAVGHVDEVEEGDLPAAPSSSATSRHPKYPLPPVTCACRPVATQMSIPCARHHAMLRRIPSSSSISGS